ncbi:MAG: group II intron maturase-specific domain-containing protein [Bacteroidales bacterium]
MSKNKKGCQSTSFFIGVTGMLIIYEDVHRAITSKEGQVYRVNSRNRGCSLRQIVQELNPILRGWLNCFKYAQRYERVGE